MNKAIASKFRFAASETLDIASVGITLPALRAELQARVAQLPHQVEEQFISIPSGAITARFASSAFRKFSRSRITRWKMAILVVATIVKAMQKNINLASILPETIRSPLQPLDSRESSQGRRLRQTILLPLLDPDNVRIRIAQNEQELEGSRFKSILEVRVLNNDVDATIRNIQRTLQQRLPIILQLLSKQRINIAFP